MNVPADLTNVQFTGIGRKARGILRRVVVTGSLTLETPARFGSGDNDGLTDMPLLRDPLENKPLLTGSSIAGALRAYLRELELGYGIEKHPKLATKSMAEALFGHLEESAGDQKASIQSWLLIDDALGEFQGVEIREGVALDPKTRTARDKKKFDWELLQAGTRFPLSLELLVGEDELLLDGLVYALHGLQTGEISLGQRKKRGLGQCKVDSWSVSVYDLTNPHDLIAWLEQDRSGARTGDNILELLPPKKALQDQRRYFTVTAEFRLESSVLIRSSSGDSKSPDLVHLHSNRIGDEQPVPIVSGTSVAGAIRARAARIAQTMVPDKASKMIDGMFGAYIDNQDDKPTGSRLVVKETVVTGTQNLVQSRVKIDRFTGGSYPHALFTEQPEFGGEHSTVKLELTLRNPQDPEIGVLLLVLKDLWTADLALGGESSVGRGYLCGKNATLTLHEGMERETWTITPSDQGIDVTGTSTDPKKNLERYVQAFLSKVVV